MHKVFLKNTKFVVAVLIMLMTATTLFGQAEKAAYKVLAGHFEKNYNNENYDSIIAEFSAEMQNALPSEQAPLGEGSSPMSST